MAEQDNKPEIIDEEQDVANDEGIDDEDTEESDEDENGEDEPTGSV